MIDIAELINRAANEPDFLAGIVPADQLNTVLGMTETSRQEIAETLRARIAHGHFGKQ
jgi:hypothetical protein